MKDKKEEEGINRKENMEEEKVQDQGRMESDGETKGSGS